MAALTIYNHGTTNDSNQNFHVITMLANDTQQPKTVTQGVGSDMIAEEFGLDAIPLGKGLNWLGGVEFGAGIDHQVREGCRFVLDYYTNNGIANIDAINICGYSRGGITSFKQANSLHRWTNPAGATPFQNIPFNIFAIDPVPGNLGLTNNHVYKRIELQASVAKCTVILSEHERRDAFRPVLDRGFFSIAKQHDFISDTMPGNHKGIVEIHGTRDDAPYVILKLAKEFLGTDRPVAQQTAFINAAESNDVALQRYARIMVDIQGYKAQGFTLGGENLGENLAAAVFSGGITKGDRVVQTKNPNKGFWEKNLLGIPRISVPGQTKNKYHGIKMKKLFGELRNSKRFFANRHHRGLFTIRYPNTSPYILQIETGQGNDQIQIMLNDANVTAEMNAAHQDIQDHFNGWAT